MGTSLSIEPIAISQWIPSVEKFVLNAGRSKAREIVELWRTGSRAADVDTFNLASIVQFTDFTANLEGLKNSDGTGVGSRWRNLPYWMAAIWLPLNGSIIEPAVETISGEPVMIATAYGLRRDLDEIQNMSPISLGEKPKRFDLMLSNPRQFYEETATVTFSEADTIKWIWFANSWTADKVMSANLPARQAG